MTPSTALALALVLFGPAPAPQVGEAAAGAPAKPAAAPAADAGAAAASFEALGHGAVRTRDIETLLSSIVERCDSEKRDLDRVRCQATTAYLRRTLPAKTFAFTSDEPGVVAVSDYDAAVKGYHVALAGCVACSKPVTIGKAKEPRFVTLKVPEAGADSLAKAVALSHNTFGFDSLAEAKRWLEAERPFLRAEFLFQPQIVGDVWTFGAGRGVSLKLVGARVYNRCTGDVLVSKPPSTAMADRPGPAHEDPACAARASAAEAAAPPPPPPLADRPSQLSQALIADAMAKIRPQVFACYQQFKVPGMVELAFVVAGNGTVQSVTVSAAWRGTPTGACVKEAAKDAHFAPFQLDEQKFTYPFFLRQ
ncbi:MAG TPA: hypothetical protein VIF57_11180 [Polyangia bacterium]|jgi:hypothetical protein